MKEGAFFYKHATPMELLNRPFALSPFRILLTLPFNITAYYLLFFFAFASAFAFFQLSATSSHLKSRYGAATNFSSASPKCNQKINFNPDGVKVCLRSVDL
jgi:hypothetical protein